jgi:hypothetical protein
LLRVVLLDGSVSGEEPLRKVFKFFLCTSNLLHKEL